MKEILERIKSLRLLVVGDVMLDRYVVGEVNRISPEAPVPVLTVEAEREVAGGAANVALNAAELGAQQYEELSHPSGGRKSSWIQAREPALVRGREKGAVGQPLRFDAPWGKRAGEVFCR